MKYQNKTINKRLDKGRQVLPSKVYLATSISLSGRITKGGEMTNKDYAIKLTKEIRDKQAELIKDKPQLRNLNPDNYAKALRVWKNRYFELETTKNDILANYKAGVKFIQI